MRQYKFICPLPGCGMLLTAHAQTKDQGIAMLIDEAHRHLATAHPDIHKTNGEVSADITAHMVEEN